MQPMAGEPTRPLPPYRPNGPQAPGAPAGPPPGAVSFSPIPSQSTAASVAAARESAAQVPGTYAPAGSYNPGQPTTSFTPAPAAASFTPGGAPTTSFAPVPPAPAQSFAPAGAPAGYAPSPVAAPAAPMPASARTFAPAPEAPAPAAPAAPAQAAAAPTRDRGARRGAEMPDESLPIDQILTEMVAKGASDVHFTSGAVPMIRVSGALKPLEGYASLTPEPLRRSIYAIMTQKQRETFEANLELDFSYSVRGLARFRVNIYQQRESVGAAFRVIPYEIKPLEDLGVPAVVGNFAGMPRGLVLVTGPTGSGKSTTLASIVDLANRTREDHIMTVEDPIEFLHRHKKSLVNQREVGQDTHSFANALKHVLRQDPDIILVGEMRDLETISVALTAAETGHLVFATLHTQDAAQTIDRVIDVFPSGQQAQVRTQLAGAIQGVVCQTLCKKADGVGRAVATEVLVATPAIRNLIREGKTHQIYSAMQAGAKQGMHTMDQHLADLVKSGKISYEVGLEKCHHVEDFNRLTGRFSGGAQGAAAAHGTDMAGAVQY